MRTAAHSTLDGPDFDGHEAVHLIIERAHAPGAGPLVLLPVGKPINIALALKKDPSIAPRVRIVWLGFNYPEPGGYNQNADPESLRFLLDTDVAFEMVTVRYGRPSSTDAVRVTSEEVRARVAGRGPRVEEAAVGGQGGALHTFCDYSGNLFEHIDLYGDAPSRALSDMAAVAIVKEPAWATARRIPVPRLVGHKWVERPENPHNILLWEHFDRDAIIEDFFRALERPVLAGR